MNAQQFTQRANARAEVVLRGMKDRQAVYINDLGFGEIVTIDSEPWMVGGCWIIKIRGRKNGHNAGGFACERVVPIET